MLSQYNVGAQTRRTANVEWHGEDLLEIHEADAEARRALLAAWAGWTLDSLDVMLYALVMPSIMAALHLTPATAGARNIGWLFRDPVAAAKDYYKRTGIFPIMHLIGVRRTLAEKHPWLPAAVLKAFEQSKAAAMAICELRPIRFATLGAIQRVGSKSRTSEAITAPCSRLFREGW